MAKIRTIKPEFWEDEDIAKLPFPCRLFFVGMWSFADDYGVIKASPVLLKSKIFPYDTIRVDEISKWLDALVNARMILPIQFKSESYYVIRTFRTHQKIDSRWGKPLIDEETLNQLINECSREHDEATARPQCGHTSGSGYVSVNGDVGGYGSGIPPLPSDEGSTPAPQDIGSISPPSERTPPDSGAPPSQEDADFKAFQEWILKKAPTVAKMKEPFTKEEYLQLRKDFTPQHVKEMLVAMHNWEPLLKKCKSANLTFRKWSKKEFNDNNDGSRSSNSRSATGTGGVRQRDTSVSPDYQRNVLERLGVTGSTEKV